MVLNKPFGLAVQGGSGTKRHIDGMLASLADERGDRPVLVHRLDRDTSGVLLVAKTAQDGRRPRRDFPLAAGAEDLLGAGRGRAEARRRGASRCISPRARRWATTARRARPHGRTARDIEKMRVAKHGEDDAQHSLTYYAMVDKVAPRLRLAVDEAADRPHASIARPCRGDRPCPIVGDPKYGHRPEDDDAPRAIRCARLPDGVERKLHLLARRLILPHPQGRHARRHRAAAAAYAEELGLVRLRREAVRSDRGRAGGVRGRLAAVDCSMPTEASPRPRGGRQITERKRIEKRLRRWLRG